MPRLSEAAHLSQHYTNHDIRVTATTILAREGFSYKQIMSVTGHKSVQSLAIYHKVGGSEKLMMGNTLGKCSF